MKLGHVCNKGLPRRTFLWSGAGAAALFGPLSTAWTEGAPADNNAVDPAFPAQSPEAVREMVAVSHGNYQRVRELVDARPALAKATWDWGFGDWESALGAASHTGSRDIALLLIEKGARPTLFSAAMLGQLEVVRAFVAASPDCQSIPGPHGIPLLNHARFGKEPARAVVEYLEGIGGADARPPSVTLNDRDQQRYLGTYRFADGEEDYLKVFRKRGRLMIQRGERVARGLTAVGDHAFRPAGADAVRIRFEVTGEEAPSVSVFDPELIVRAVRVAVK